MPDRTDRELHVRTHHDGNRIVFARERNAGDARSRDLYTATIDGSTAELQLIRDNQRDDFPCWSPDGSTILFASDRGGASALYTIPAGGGAITPFHTPPAGFADSEPDWHRGTSRVLFTRSSTTGPSRLMLADASGGSVTQLTDGGSIAGGGDRHGSFSPDGSRVVFVRNLAGADRVMFADVTTGQTEVRFDAFGSIAHPRWSPNADRVFCGLAQPLAGRPTLRLAVLPADGSSPLLLWPDVRWQVDGLDVLPGMAPARLPGSPQVLDVMAAELQIAAGSAVSGGRRQLANEDGDELALATTAFEGREIAGINCKFTLPVAVDRTAAMQVRVLARATRVGGDSALRLSLYNPVEERFDTVVEQTPGATSALVLSFATNSQRHLTVERQFRVTVIADLAPGARAELRVDQVQVTLVPFAVTPP